MPLYTRQEARELGVLAQALTEAPGQRLAAEEVGRVGLLKGAPTSFKTFLSIVETAGLTEELANGGPYLVLAPIEGRVARWSAPE